MSDVDKSRRDALKKLGLGTGAVWAAPAATVLVVPQHAHATSSSGTPLSSGSSIEYKSGGPVMQLALTTSDFASIGATSTSTVVLYGTTLSSYTSASMSFDGRHYFYAMGINSAPFSNGVTGSVTVDGTTYTATTSVS